MKKEWKSKRQKRHQRVVSANLQILKEIKNSDEHENREEEDEELKEEIDMRVDIQSSRIQRDHYSQEKKGARRGMQTLDTQLLLNHSKSMRMSRVVIINLI